jgi:hypothetical protein
MKCLDTKHRYRLVGYRDRKPEDVGTATEKGFCLMDALMACTRCPEVKEVAVTRPVEVKVIGGTRKTDRS